MKKNYPALKNLAPIIFLFFAFTAFSQVSGDFRSKAIGPSNWTSAASWETWNGSSWIAATTYPGEITGTNTVTIQLGHIIKIVTNLDTPLMGSVIVNGTLNLVALNNSSQFNIILNTTLLTVSGTGLINFNGTKISLILPVGVLIEILDGGRIEGDCNNNVEILIGNQQFAVCQGTGNSDLVTIVQMIDAGGTINANITAPSSNPTITCGLQSTTLQGSYSGIVSTNANPVIYEWKVKDPNNVEVIISNTSSASFTPSLPLIPGDYLVSFKVTTSLSGTPFSNIETRTITVKALPEAPTSVATATTICSGNSTTLSYIGGSGTTFNWYTSSCGETLVGTGNNLIVSPTTTTTYYGRWENSCGNSLCKTVTVSVNPLPTSSTTTNAAICSGSSATLVASGAISGQSYNWYTVATGGSSVNTTNSYNTPALTETTDYWVSIVNSNGCESERTKVTAFVNVNNIWNGSVDKDWNKDGNWCIGVPTFGVPNTLDVLIPAGLTNYPIILAGSVLGGYVENIVFEPGTTLNVIDNRLHVIKNLTLNGNSKIDLEGESQLLQDTGSLLDPASTGSIEIDQQGTGNSFRYNYWSSPVNSRGAKYTIGEVLKNGTNPITPITYGAAYAFADGAVTSPIKLSTYWMYVLRNSGSGYAAWNRVGNTGEVSVGEGYTMKGSNTSAAIQNYTFVGKPNNGDITLTLNAGFDYLVGNPYPSALNAYRFLMDNKNSIEGAIYFWEHYGGDTHNLAGYQAGYATRNLTGGTPATSPSNVSNVVAFGVIKKTPAPSIAVGQAFFVVGDAGGGNIVFKNSQREFVKESSGDAVFMKTNSTKAKTENTSSVDLRPKFRIGFDAPKISHRQLLLGIDERATNGVDWGFDAEIYEVFADDMYWMLDGKKYVIEGTNAIGLNSEVPLGIQLSKTGVVTVKIDALENVDDDTSIYLKDKLTGESFNMKDKPVQLNLTAGKYADRFAITFKTQKLMAEDVKAEILVPAVAQPIIVGIHVFMNNAMKELQIKNNSDDEILSIELYNYLGQTVKTWNSNFKIRTISLPISTATGVYLVQINTKTGSEVQKVVVE